MLDRNLMELAHRGVSFGGDLLSGHRAHWRQWGGVAFDAPDVQREKDYLAASVYAVAAGGVPFVPGERHRLVWSAYGGIGEKLDRLSPLPVPRPPTGDEMEALSPPLFPCAALH